MADYSALLECQYLITKTSSYAQLLTLIFINIAINISKVNVWISANQWQCACPHRKPSKDKPIKVKSLNLYLWCRGNIATTHHTSPRDIAIPPRYDMIWNDIESHSGLSLPYFIIPHRRKRKRQKNENTISTIHSWFMVYIFSDSLTLSLPRRPRHSEEKEIVLLSFSLQLCHLCNEWRKYRRIDDFLFVKTISMAFIYIIYVSAY